MWAQLIAGAFQGLGSIRQSSSSNTGTIIVAAVAAAILLGLVYLIVRGDK